jgi:hypothetical protein
MSYIEISGRKFGRLTALCYADHRNGYARWLCKCECGEQKIVHKTSLMTGDTMSCGCLAREMTSKRSLKSGDATRRTTEYQAWHSMKDRCLRKNHPHYKDYGGRGITVCPEWIASFEAFLRDVGRKPSPELTLERIDNNDGYNKRNVKWATWNEQARNRRKPKRRHKTT